MTITREQIEMYASAADATQTFGMDKGKLIAVEPEHMQELARMALAGMEAEPVAWRWNYGGTTSWRLQETKPNYGDNHKFPRVIQPLYTSMQGLTTSERAELENYRNAQQVVPGDIDARMKSAGMLSAAEIISGQPIDAFVKHAGVVDMGSLLQWSEMRRAEFLRMQSRYELGDKEKDDLYEWVVSHIAVFSELHVNIRAAMQSGAVKDGWVMVPVEPTKEMVDSLRSAITPGFALPYLVAGYKTMIAEAPKYEDSK